MVQLQAPHLGARHPPLPAPPQAHLRPAPKQHSPPFLRSINQQRSRRFSDAVQFHEAPHARTPENEQQLLSRFHQKRVQAAEVVSDGTARHAPGSTGHGLTACTWAWCSPCWMGACRGAWLSPVRCGVVRIASWRPPPPEPSTALSKAGAPVWPPSAPAGTGGREHPPSLAWG